MSTTDPTSPDSPDRHRLDDLIRLSFDQAGASGGEDTVGVTAQEIAAKGPYSVALIVEHLEAEGEAYQIQRTEDGLRVTGVGGPLDS